MKTLFLIFIFGMIGFVLIISVRLLIAFIFTIRKFEKEKKAAISDSLKPKINKTNLL